MQLTSMRMLVSGLNPFEYKSIQAHKFSSTPNDPNWNHSDINNDNLVDIFDIVVVALHFG